MPSIIKIKRSETAGNPAVLGAGELAYSALTDNGANGGDRLYIGSGTETAGNAVNHVVIGGKYFTDKLDHTPGVLTASSAIIVDSNSKLDIFNVDNLQFNGSTISSTDTNGNIVILPNGTGSISLDGQLWPQADGGANQFLKTDGAGQLSWAAIPSGSFNIAGNIGTDTFTTGDTLTFEGGTGVITTVTDNKVSFAIGQSVATTDNVSFNSVTVNGTLTSDDITSTNISIAGNATITGNLTVQGTTTTVNSTEVAISDLNVTLAKDATTAAAANGAGITVAGAAATITYTSANDRWNLNKDLVVTNLYGNASTASALQTARSITVTGDASWSVSFSGASDVSAALTLTTVNANTGSFGDSVTVPNFTVNAKGLITAAGSAAIPTASTSVLGLASFSSTNFSVAAGAVTISAVDGGTY